MTDLTWLIKLVELGAAGAVLAAVVLFLIDRHQARKADRSTLALALKDRSSERSTFATIIGNHLAHSTTAHEKLAAAVTSLAAAVATCPTKARPPEPPQ